MPSNIDLSRRSVLISTMGLPSLGVLGGLSGCDANDRQLTFLSLAAAEDDINVLASVKAATSEATWSLAQTLEHCAQSIEYSMRGFPQSKSQFFQRTVGAAALEVFSWRGRMTHDLAEPIPGAPALAVESDLAAALQRVRLSIANFRAWREPLQPHFAYGALSKSEYELAHAMHLANHLSQFHVAA
jgi:hypothetical protein